MKEGGRPKGGGEKLGKTLVVTGDFPRFACEGGGGKRRRRKKGYQIALANQIPLVTGTGEGGEKGGECPSTFFPSPSGEKETRRAPFRRGNGGGRGEGGISKKRTTGFLLGGELALDRRNKKENNTFFPGVWFGRKGGEEKADKRDPNLPFTFQSPRKGGRKKRERGKGKSRSHSVFAEEKEKEVLPKAPATGTHGKGDERGKEERKSPTGHFHLVRAKGNEERRKGGEEEYFQTFGSGEKKNVKKGKREESGEECSVSPGSPEKGKKKSGGKRKEGGGTPQIPP